MPKNTNTFFIPFNLFVFIQFKYSTSISLLHSIYNLYAFVSMDGEFKLDKGTDKLVSIFLKYDSFMTKSKMNF